MGRAVRDLLSELGREAQNWVVGSFFASDVFLAARGEHCRAFAVFPPEIGRIDQVEGEG